MFDAAVFELIAKLLTHLVLVPTPGPVAAAAATIRGRKQAPGPAIQVGQVNAAKVAVSALPAQWPVWGRGVAAMLMAAALQSSVEHAQASEKAEPADCPVA